MARLPAAKETGGYERTVKLNVVRAAGKRDAPIAVRALYI
jgi:hypothetical protein